MSRIFIIYIGPILWGASIGILAYGLEHIWLRVIIGLIMALSLHVLFRMIDNSAGE